MNWEVICNERSSLQEYRLIDNNQCKLVIKYNPRHYSARITSGNHHRLFFFESAGSLSGKTIFRNEYGMEVGNLVHDKFHPKEGSLVIDTKKYKYQLQYNPSPQFFIYGNDHEELVATCSIQSNNNNNSSPGANSIENNCFLLGLCWFLFLPHSIENLAEYALA